MNAPLVFAALDEAGEPRVLAAVRRRADGRVAALFDPNLLTADPARGDLAPGARTVPRLGHCDAKPQRGWEALFDGVAHADSLPARPGLGALRPVDLVFLGSDPSSDVLFGTPWYAPGGGRYAPRMLTADPEGAAAWIDGERGAVVALGDLSERERNLAELVAEAASESGAAGPLERWLGEAAHTRGAGLAGAAREHAVRAAKAALIEVLSHGRGGSHSLGDGQQLDLALTHEEGGFALDLAYRSTGGETQLLRLGLARFGSISLPKAWDVGPVLVFERPTPGESVLARIRALAPYIVELCAAANGLRPHAPPERGTEPDP